MSDTYLLLFCWGRCALCRPMFIAPVTLHAILLLAAMHRCFCFCFVRLQVSFDPSHPQRHAACTCSVFSVAGHDRRVCLHTEGLRSLVVRPGGAAVLPLQPLERHDVVHIAGAGGRGGPPCAYYYVSPAGDDSGAFVKHTANGVTCTRNSDAPTNCRHKVAVQRHLDAAGLLDVFAARNERSANVAAEALPMWQWPPSPQMVRAARCTLQLVSMVDCMLGRHCAMS